MSPVRNLGNRTLALALGILAAVGLSSAAAADGADAGRVELVIDWRGFTGPVTGLSFSSDGTMLAAAGQREVRIWDLRTGRLLRVIRGEIGAGGYGDVSAAAFSPDNCELVVGIRGKNGTGALRTYDVRNMAVMKDLIEGLPDAVERLAFSRDGRHLVVACTGGAIVAYDWRLRRLVGARDAEADAARAWLGFALAEPLLVRLEPDRSTVLSVPGLEPLPIDRRIPASIAHWIEARGHIRPPFVGRFRAFDLHLDQDRWLAGGLGTNEGSKMHWVGLWVGAAANPAAVYTKHRGQITAVSLDWLGILAASADQYGEIHVWETETGQARYVFRSVGHPVYRAAFDVRAARIGFTTRSAASGQWGRNRYGTIDRVFDLSSRAILQAPEGEFPPEILNRDAALSLDYLDGRFDFQLALTDGRTFDYPMSAGEMPTTYTLLVRERFGAELPVVVGNEDGRLFAFDPVARRIAREFLGHRAFVTSLSESADGRFLTTSSADRTIRLWSLDDVRERGDAVEPLLNLAIIDEDDWIIWTPQGYYDASPGCGDLVGWHVNRGPDQIAAFYSLHQFRAQLYRPDLVNRVLRRGNVEAAIAEADAGELAPSQPIRPGLAPAQPIAQPSAVTQPIAPLAIASPITSPVPLATDFRKPETIAKLKPPRIRLLSPEDGATIREGQIHLLAEVISANQMPITEVKVLVNGRPASGKGISVLAADETSGQEASFSRVVKLMPGENEIAVLARNEVATSAPIVIRVKYDAPAKALAARPNLYMLSVGISDYRDSSLSLRFAHRDAQAFVDAWESQRGPVFENVHKALLLNEEATADRVRQAMEDLAARVQQGDVAVIFISAHGIRNRQLEYYLATHEIDPENLDQTGLHFSAVTQLLQTLPCKVFLFVDTCHAAGITGAKAIFRDPLYELTSDEYGAIVFSSSLSREISREDEKWQHGAFTKAILDTFASDGSDLNGDGFLSLSEMEQSVCERVRRLTDGEQHPVMKRPATIHNIPFYFLGKGAGENAAAGRPTLAPNAAVRKA